MLHVPCPILVLAMQCTPNIMNITWGCGRLDGLLGLIGWMSRSIVSPTAGDVVVLSTTCIVYSSLSFLFLAPVLAGSPGLSNQGFV